ncbi:MAG: hypothetical protein LIO74_05865 [Ruminococcus sp.]|nr:hypothetical protein [Ruminococcus sp.]
MQEKLEERFAFPGRYSGLHLLTSKVICGGCGEMYHPRPWYSTSYNNLKWQCKNSYRKGVKCRVPKIYDKLDSRCSKARSIQKRCGSEGC